MVGRNEGPNQRANQITTAQGENKPQTNLYETNARQENKNIFAEYVRETSARRSQFMNLKHSSLYDEMARESSFPSSLQQHTHARSFPSLVI